MRLLHVWEFEKDAYRGASYLSSEEIECHVEQNADTKWELWVHEERDRKRAIELFKEYIKNPDSFKVTSKVSKEHLSKPAIERRIDAEDEALRNRVRLDQERVPVVTYFLMTLSIAVALYTNVGEINERLFHLTFTKIIFENGSWISQDDAILQGDVWRLFTPMFIHFGYLHIIFNMMWLIQLGSMIERRFGSNYLILSVIAIEVISSISQLYIGGILPAGYGSIEGRLFGGMSGVNYGLFGFLWIRGKMLPQHGMIVHPQVVILLVAWYFFCLVGAVGNVANTAHTVGLVYGMAWGYLSAKNFERKNQPRL